MGIDQFFVDPVAAAYRQLFDVELANGQHLLAEFAVEYIAIDIDVGEVVIGSDLLHLTQGVLQRSPVPEADVLKRWLVVAGVGLPQASPPRETRSAKNDRDRTPAASSGCCA